MRDHLAAQDPDFVPEQKGKRTRTALSILDDCQADLEKYAGRGKADSEAAKSAAMLVSQIRKGRGALFAAAMRAMARQALKDDAAMIAKLEAMQ
jgi:hypothetical protein